jgi:D-glycero-alpha-D-manno-heptose-7-phosphate kinase
LEEFRAHAEKCGAIGWKILGAGGGGFFLFWLKENDKIRFLNDFKLGIQIPFEIEFEGSQSLNSNFFRRVGYNYL